MAKAKKRKEPGVFKPARPVYDLCVLNTVTGRKGKLGAAWALDGGALRLQLNPCVVLGPETLKDCVLTLFLCGDSTNTTENVIPPNEISDMSAPFSSLGTFGPLI